MIGEYGSAGFDPMGLDLERLVLRLGCEDGVEDPHRSIDEYKEWLKQVVDAYYYSPVKGKPLLVSPSVDVEKVWQRHMLDTYNYMSDCRLLFGDENHPENEVPHYIHRDVAKDYKDCFPRGVASVDHLGVCRRGEIELKGKDPVDTSELVGITKAVSKLLPLKQKWCKKSEPLAQITLANIADTTREYSRWLELLGHSKTQLTPSKLVDEVWHYHILNSREYVKFCVKHFGLYIHHTPSYDKSHSYHRPAYFASLNAYEKRFGTKPPSSHWEVLGECGGGGGCGGGGCGGGGDGGGKRSYDEGERCCDVFVCIIFIAGITALLFFGIRGIVYNRGQSIPAGVYTLLGFGIFASCCLCLHCCDFWSSYMPEYRERKAVHLEKQHKGKDVIQKGKTASDDTVDSVHISVELVQPKN